MATRRNRAAAYFWRQSVAVQRINSDDPQAWLVDTRARIATHPAQRLDELADVELDGDHRRGGLSLAQVNKVHHVTMLGEDEDWLRDVAIEMDQEHGLIWVYGPGDERYGVHRLRRRNAHWPIKIYKSDPNLLNRSTDSK